MKKLAIENELGHVDLKHNTLPKRYVHVEGRRLQLTCRSLGIRFCNAVIDVRKGRWGKPLFVMDGVVISAKQEARLRVAIEKREQRSARAKERREAAELTRREQHLERLKNLTIAEAIVEGCATMFRLNRAAKAGGMFDREEIYALKNRWIQFLYEAGYCDRCEIHDRQHEEKKCYRCCSVTVADDEDCYSCDGTGVYRDAWTERFVVFSFLVEGVRYTWHQPVRYVRFAYVLTNEIPEDFSVVNRSPNNDRPQIPRDMEIMKACISALERSGMISDSVDADVSCDK